MVMRTFWYLRWYLASDPVAKMDTLDRTYRKCRNYVDMYKFLFNTRFSSFKEQFLHNAYCLGYLAKINDVQPYYAEVWWFNYTWFSKVSIQMRWQKWIDTCISLKHIGVDRWSAKDLFLDVHAMHVQPIRPCFWSFFSRLVVIVVSHFRQVNHIIWKTAELPCWHSCCAGMAMLMCWQCCCFGNAAELV